MRKDNGITLIALVVTIVVLLILAAVSISMLTGENGIITQAQRARTENRAGTVEERVKLWKNEVIAANYDYTDNDVDTENEMLQKLLDEDLVEEEEIDRNAKIITIGERDIDYSMTIEIPIYDYKGGNTYELSFYIKCEYGMTWREFVESSYNTEAFFINIDSTIWKESDMLYKGSDIIVNPDDEILQDEQYILMSGA